jgi:hypothetical protein
LDEIKLENKYGTLLTSQMAEANNGIAAASDQGNFPNSTAADFGSVSLINKDGEFTWPIVLVTYLYVRSDLTKFMPIPLEQTLLISFLESFLIPAVVDVCHDKYKLTIPPPAIQNITQSGIDIIKTSISPNATAWLWETSTIMYTGAALNSISLKRRQISQIDREELDVIIANISGTITGLNTNIGNLSTVVEKAGLGSATSGATNYASQNDAKIQAALILSSLSLVLCIIILAMLIMMRLNSCHKPQPEQSSQI